MIELEWTALWHRSRNSNFSYFQNFVVVVSVSVSISKSHGAGLSKRWTSGGPLQVLPLAERVVELRMCAAPVNTFGCDLLVQFKETVESLEAREDVSGLVLTSGLPGVFSAGLDLKVLHGPTEVSFKNFWGIFEDAWYTYYMSSLATVAAVNGSAPALGAVWTLSSDSSIMVNNSKFKFGLNETALGMNPPMWLRGLVERKLGPRQAEYHLQNSTMCNPQLALDIGYLDALVDDESNLLPAALETIKPYLKIPQLAREQTKRGFRGKVASLAGEASVNLMADSVLGNEFQNTVGAILESMRLRKEAAEATARSKVEVEEEK